MRNKIIIALILFGVLIAGVVVAEVYDCCACGGTGQVICRTCDGDSWMPDVRGTVVDWLGCTSCGGNGGINPSKYNGGNGRPGKGTVDCSKCNGYGYVKE